MDNVSKKLYKVTLRGMTYGATASNFIYGISYVVALNLDDAYDKVKKFLDEKNIGLSKDRVLDKIELIAENDQYNDTGIMLYL